MRALSLCLLLVACDGGRPAEAERASPRSSPRANTALGFPDEAAARGVDFVNRSGEAAKRTILEANGAGVCVLDLGGDDDLDLVFAQGLASLAQLASGPGADLAVYENDGTGHFTRVPGPGLSGWWTGLATGDLDDDGDADLVAGGFGALVVLLQDEAGRLQLHNRLLPDDPARTLTIGAARPAGSPPDWISSLALFDADRDGRLDLYVGRYLDLDPVAPPLGALGEGSLALPCRWREQDVYCGPRGLAAQPDALLFGLGGGRFEERAGALPDVPAGYTLALAPFDADGDGDTDVCVANDSSPNLLLINDGAGRFEDHGWSAGIALSVDGEVEAGMGLAVGDVDRDGRPDLALTNFSGEPTELFLAGEIGFDDATYRYGLAAESRALLSWSAHLADFDGDGWLELFTANGHVYPQADAPGSGTSYAQPDTLWRLGPEPRARRVDAQGAGSILAARAGTRGSALGDLDGDGAPDLVLARIDGPAAVGMNRLGDGTRLAVRLVGPREPTQEGPRTPRDGHGARAILVVDGPAGEFALTAEVQTCVGYQSASTPWLHFGLGPAREFAELRVLWPSGRVQTLAGGRAARRLWIEEGLGIVRAEDLPVMRAAWLLVLPWLQAPEQRVAAWRDAVELELYAEVLAEGPAAVSPGGELEAHGEAIALVARALFAGGRDALGEGLLAHARPSPATRAWVELARAQRALERDRLDEALELLSVDGVRPAPGFDARPDALLTLARALTRAGRPADADPLLREFLERAPQALGAPTAWHLLATHAVRRRDLEAARELRARATQSARWHAYLKARRLQLREHPEAPLPRLGLGQLWLEADVPERARAVLEELTVLAPDFARGWSHLALARRRTGDPAGARAALDRALELAPDDSFARHARATLALEQGRDADARGDLEHLVGLAPSDPDGDAGASLPDPRVLDALRLLARALGEEDPARSRSLWARYRALGGAASGE